MRRGSWSCGCGGSHRFPRNVSFCRDRAGVLAGRLLVAAAGGLACGLVAGQGPGIADASQLLVPAIGAPDAAMGGATVASPLTPTAAAFSNPAGITNLESGSVSSAIGIIVGHSRLHTTIPDGYDTTSDFVSYAPETGYVYATESGIRWGFAAYGSLGATFDSDAEPSVGVNDEFRSTTMLSNMAVMVAMPVGDRLSVGAALAGVYGRSHLRYFQDFDYKVQGPGVQAIFGLRYQVTDQVALGFSVRTPGKVWAEGDNDDWRGQDVKLDLHLPAQVFLGLNANLTSRIDVGLYGRFTDASTFGDSMFRFEDAPAANVAFVPSATDEWRISAGAGYKLTETVTVRGAVGYADGMVPDEGVSPLLIDSAEWKVGGGLSWDVAGWTLDFTVGDTPTGDRTISSSDAMIYPGRYKIGGEIYMLGFRTTL